MGFQILKMEAVEDVSVVESLPLQSQSLEVQSLQAIQEVSPLSLLHSAFRWQTPRQTNCLHDKQAIFPVGCRLQVGLHSFVDLPEV